MSIVKEDLPVSSFYAFLCANFGSLLFFRVLFLPVLVSLLIGDSFVFVFYSP